MLAELSLLVALVRSQGEQDHADLPVLRVGATVEGAITNGNPEIRTPTLVRADLLTFQGTLLREE